MAADYGLLEPELYHALRRLADPASDQIDYLRQLDQDLPKGLLPSIDEIALEFDDVVFLARAFLERGDITPEKAEAIYAVDRKLSAMSGADHADLWTPEALESSDAWADVRRLAARALPAVERLRR